MYPERLKRAREAAGLSLRALAEQVDVSQTAIKKYEDGVNTPDSSQLIKLAKALGVRSEYFFRPFTVQLDETVEYRKRANTPAKLLKRIHADVIEQAERWHELTNLYPQFPVKPFAVPVGLPATVNSLDEVEHIAALTREAWKLGEDPITDLVDVLETHGILVIFTALENEEKFDGLATHIAEQPVIVVSQSWAGDRQRFTLAHELGHLLLHERLAEGLDEEKACHRFAGALLLPATAILQQLGQQRRMIEWQELYLLKHEFGLSMAGCLFRALHTDIISKPVFDQLWLRFSKHGWRKQEPNAPYPAEQTILFKQLVYRALAEDWIGESKAAELLGMPLARFHRERKLEGADAATHQ
jgi:Zn-dependent peptidase ImmA (M78 family)/DNA-binding XRE family transcriptional regulator